MEFILVDILVCFIENFILIQLLDYYLSEKSKTVRILFWIALSLFSCSTTLLEIPSSFLLGGIAFVAYAIFNYFNPLKTKLIVSMFIFLLNALITTLILSAMIFLDSSFLEKLYSNPLLYGSLAFSSKFILILVAAALQKFCCIYYTKSSMLLFFSEAALFLFASFYVFIAELNQLVDIKIAFVFFSMIFLLFFVLLIALSQFFKYKQKNLYLIMKNESLKNYASGYMENKLIYEQQDHILHEIKTKTILLRKALEENDTHQAMHILDSFSLGNTEKISFADNPDLDYVVHSKLASLHHHHFNIRCIFETDIQDITNEEAIVLIGNVFELVSSFAEKEPYSSLVVTKTPVGTKLVLSFETQASEYEIKNSELLKNTLFIAHQNNADYNIQYTPNFTLNLLLES